MPADDAKTKRICLHSMARHSDSIVFAKNQSPIKLLHNDLVCQFMEIRGGLKPTNHTDDHFRSMIINENIKH